MLAAFEANFKHATFSHSFATLLSLVNNKQAEEGIHEFRACFEGHLHNMSQLTVSIPPILQAMLFLRALHPHYKAIIDLSASKQKDFSVALTDSIVLDAQFMDELSFFGSNGNPDAVTDRGSSYKIDIFLPQTSFLELDHVNICYMTSHVKFG